MTDTIYRTTVASPFGDLRVLTSERGVVAVVWPGDRRVNSPADATSNSIGQEAAQQLSEYFAGERTCFDLPLDLRGTEFQKQVWESLATIPFGQTVSYAEQAERVGRPSAVRAVAAANGKNPVSIVLPCHRVIGSDGSLTGYAAGLDAKRWLLAHEGSQAVAPTLPI